MVNLIKIGGRYNAQIEEYDVETEEELAQIPETAPVGSVANVIETGKCYKKTSDGMWTELVDGSHGSGGGSGAPIYIPFDATVDEQTGAINATTTAVYADVKAAVIDKKNVIAELSMDGFTVYCRLTVKVPTTDPTILTFTAVADFGDSNGTIEVYLFQISFEHTGLVDVKMIALKHNDE